MRKNLFFLAITLLIINGCKKDEPVPISSFSFRGDTITTLKMATSDTCTLINTSKNADSVFWDFGDGRTSIEKQIILSYPKSGSYSIKLTTTNNNGQKSFESKKVVILDRILKKVVIDFVQWDPTNRSEGWPTSTIADIYFQIQMFTDNTMNPIGIFPNCPVLFTSPIVKDVTNHFTPPASPIEIPITEKIIIDKNMVQRAYQGNINKAYLFSLMAKTADGKIYCLVNSGFISGSSFGIYKEDFALNTFIVSLQFFSSFKLVCDFE